MSFTVNFNPEKFKGTLGDELRRRLAQAGIQVERSVKRLMPSGGFGKTHTPSQPGSPPAVDTGRLRSSITYAVTDGKSDSPSGKGAQSEDGIGPISGGKDEIFVVVGTRTNYAPYLEFGTSKMAARPFLRPGLEQSKSDIQTIFSKK